MKKKTHPQYFEKSSITCSSCGSTHSIGSTSEKMSVEICSNCHPIYTGKHRVLDTTGRVEKFNRKYSQFLKNS